MKRILFGAAYSVIEPLGVLHLAGLARDMGWDRQIHLVKDHDFSSFFDEVKNYKPDVVGFNVYTGNHLQLKEAFKKLKRDFPNIQTIVGGPHPTYFPSESAEFADFVVMREGFKPLEKILKGEAKKGVLVSNETATFPLPDRKTFYEKYPEHAKSPIKSFITMTGCPYSCTYCYNSSELSDIQINPDQKILLEQLEAVKGNLFPKNVRSVEDVIKEVQEVVEKWNTSLMYCQDDVHGFDVKKWLPQFKDEWNEKIGIPYHAQMRWEMTSQDKRLDLLREANCDGLTLAIEAANPIIRGEVLDRRMNEEIIFEGMQKLTDKGFKVRTEQISGLPYGATSIETPVNLDADLSLVELNVRLKEQTNGPTMAWASTFAPYRGTKLGLYSERFGHYVGNNSDVPDTFFEQSVLRFPKEWVGLGLEKIKEDDSVWLSPDELKTYREQNAELRRVFNLVTSLPEGHKLARKYIQNGDYSYETLSRNIQDHLQFLNSTGNSQSQILLDGIEVLKNQIGNISMSHREKKQIEPLIPTIGALPKPFDATKLIIDRMRQNSGELTPNIFSTAVRHFLYDYVLYEVKGRTFNEVAPNNRVSNTKV